MVEPEPVVRVGLVEMIGERLERMILAGTVPPGTRMNESHLAASLGTSRGPLREALRRLERAGLLESATHRGCYVRQIGLNEGRECYEIRAELEALAGRKACARLADADVAALADRMEEMKSAAAAGDVAGYFRSNLAFHDAIVRCAASRVLIELYADLVKRITLFRLNNLGRPQGLRVSLAEHGAIFRALRARDAKRAGSLLRRHTLSALARLTEEKTEP